jgi:hypothetical protein
LLQTPATSIADVIARMEAIDQTLPPTDGVSCFNKLYLEVTKNVLTAAEQAAYADPRFLATLDVTFANLYFSALCAFEAGPSMPRAWKPLCEARSTPTIAPIQFALAGMNAHINRDLPVALVATFVELGVPPRAISPQHDDFERVNHLLAATEEQVKTLYLDQLGRALDVAFDNVDDVLAMWSVGAAREAAWTNGEVMWHLRHVDSVASAYLTTLDRTVGFASRGLLVPTGRLAA